MNNVTISESSLNFTVQNTPEATNLSVSVEMTEYEVGDMVAVSGEITPPISGVSVDLSYSVGAASIATRTVTTDTNGRYTDTYELSQQGAWSVKASWKGNSDYLGAESQQASFSVVTPPMDWLPIIVVAAVALIGLALFIRRRR